MARASSCALPPLPPRAYLTRRGRAAYRSRMRRCPGLPAASWRSLIAVLVGLLVVASCASAHAQLRYPGKSWDRAPSPEVLGWSAERLKAAREYAETIQTAGVLIAVDGVVLDEWGETARRSTSSSWSG